MWTALAHTVIKYRIYFILVLVAVTIFMGSKLPQVRLSNEFGGIVPGYDEDAQSFEVFKQNFGEDGNILALGVSDSALYTPLNFQRFRYLSDALVKLEGVQQVISLATLQRLRKNTAKKKFEIEPIFEEIPDDQATLDSLLKIAFDQKFYSGQIVNESNGATIILVSIDKEILNSRNRNQLTEDIIDIAEKFAKSTEIDIKYAGLPFVRSVTTGRIQQELILFLILSIVVTALTLLFFFRSWDAVIFPLMIIGTVVIWAMGSLVLFDFKVTILTGLLPPIIVVIGIPNSVYLLNKYHQEFEKHGNKVKAISRVTRKIGFVTLITNITTAVGFIVLGFTEIPMVREFGIIAGINIVATFIVSIILIPAVFTYLPPPNRKQLKHLNFSAIQGFITLLNTIIHHQRKWIFVVSIILVIVSLIGVTKLESISYMVDDLPDDSEILTDLSFFEKNFSGIMPLEAVIDTGKKRGVTRLSNLKKINELEEFLSGQPDISQPVSIVSFIKAARQAFYNNNPNQYQLPDNRERNFILRYLDGQEDQDGNNIRKSFIDSTGQRLRVSMKMADIGSKKMKVLIEDKIKPKIQEIFGESDLDVSITGTTVLFIKGNKYLIENLRMSLILAFVIIAAIMGLLFRNARVMIISLIPNVIPLIMTAGIMGFFGLPLKPSTALIFSIAFGISVDDSIHFLAKYRQELFANNFFVPIAITKSLKDTGTSMVYTSIILFFGYIIFAFSDFGGTIALGILTSTTLLIAMVTNLVVLPALLMQFDSGKRRRDSHPLIEQYDNDFYYEDEDEEIDLGAISVQRRMNA